MANRKDELKKAKEAGKSIVAKQNAEKQAASNNPNVEEKDKPKEQSLVAKQFGNPNSKTYDDVLRENDNDPAKMADWLNNNPSYKAGNKTKQGMEGFGYTQGEDGKWAPKPKTENAPATTTTPETKTTSTTTETTTTPETETSTTTTDTTTTETGSTGATTDDALNGIEGITKEDPKADAFVNGVTNKDGSINELKTYNAMSQYEQGLVERGAGSFDKDGKFVFKDTTKKGWEDYATMLSVGLSVLGLAMGVPIIPINFRKITNKDEKDAKTRELQKQYTDIMAGNAAKVKDVESSVEAGKLAKANEDAINAYSKYKEDVGAYEAKSTIDTDSEKELIDKNLEAEMTLVNEEFKDKIGEMKLSHEQQKDLQKLLSDLSTDSAKELLNQERYGYLLDMAKDMDKAGMDDRAIALKLQSLAGKTATTQNLEHAKNIVDMLTNILESGSRALHLGGGKKKK